MTRSFAFIVCVAALVAGAVWMADNPGSVSFVWQGYRVETSMAFAIVVMILFAAAVAVSYRAWRFVRRTPANFGASMRERKKRKGYHALTRGMVAVAAGDVDGARKYAAEAQTRLDDPPLTMLLSAQAAQLAGDENAAREFFESMADNPDMAFLGLRGRLTQAIKAGDRHSALALARRAHEIKPATDWVANTLFDLQVRAGLWAAAEATAKKAGQDRVLDAATAVRHRAVALHQQSLAADKDGREAPALKLAAAAWKLAPGFAPMATHYADQLLIRGKRRKAVSVLEQSWADRPHPALIAAFGRAVPQPANDPMGWVKRLNELLAGNPTHGEALIAKAEAALTASLWGEARKHLDMAAAHGLTARLCHTYATLEDSESNDPAAGRDWLRRAAQAAPDPTWVCTSCGHQHGEWTPLCGQCDGFDTQTWRSPTRVTRLSEPDRPAAKSHGHPPASDRPPTIDLAEIPPPPDMVGPRINDDPAPDEPRQTIEQSGIEVENSVKAVK